jgi:hypothetical protein
MILHSDRPAAAQPPMPASSSDRPAFSPLQPRAFLLVVGALGLGLLAAAGAAATPARFQTGNVRVELLSDALLRLELKGPSGFEDRPTFHIANRDWPGTAFSTETNSGIVEIRSGRYTVRVPDRASSLEGVRVLSPDGSPLYQWDGRLDNSKWLPSPAEKPRAWWFADAPRLVPPSWGLTPPPNPMPNAGWDLSNDAPDVYLFIPQGDYQRLRRDFLNLTGPTEMPPLYLFGAFDSRWYDYSETTALRQVEDYRVRKIPLDVLVIDTGWRANASTGYRANTNLFPDLPRFFSEAHAAKVRVLFNDHPQPLDTNAPALDPKEVDFRFNGLSGLLKQGLDVWWYDRNWWVALVPPAPNLHKEVWGMRLYHDTTARVRPGQRPLIMANVDGIDNGLRKRPMDAAAHRYPFQWTGDIGPGWEFLRRGVENAVQAGVNSVFPYMSEDLGGHTSNPIAEQYIRWIQYGALSPVYRPHCTHNLERMPWSFGLQAEEVARNMLAVRYRLLPVFYSAARENYETGQPLLRRLDLQYPQCAEAARNDEFLLGQDILVAPVLQGSLEPVPADWFKTAAGRSGLQAEYFANEDLSGQPALSRIDPNIDFRWNDAGPSPEVRRIHFSARWTGTIEAPASVGDVKLATLEDDGARVWIDGQKVIDAWGPHDSATSEAAEVLTAGVPHQIRVEYLQLDYDAVIRLQWQAASVPGATRVAWLPPGDWVNAWTGDTIAGPAMVTNHVPLNQIPLFIRAGAVLPLAPEMQYTAEKPWSPVMLDLYPRPGQTNHAALYEDDTLTTAYQLGEFRKTAIAASADSEGRKLRVEIGAAIGSFPGALKDRAWTLRIHPPKGWPQDPASCTVQVNRKTIDTPVRRLDQAAAAMPFGDKSGAPDGAVLEVPLSAKPAAQGQSVVIEFGRLNPSNP